MENIISFLIDFFLNVYDFHKYGLDQQFSIIVQSDFLEESRRPKRCVSIAQ